MKARGDRRGKFWREVKGRGNGGECVEGEGEGCSEGKLLEGREEGGGMMRDVNLEGRDSKEGG